MKSQTSTSQPKAAPKIRVLYVTPETSPFAATGGLGEVAGSLPEAVNRQRRIPCDCRVIMPLYRMAKERLGKKLRFLGSAEVTLCWRQQYAGLYAMKSGYTTYYFIDNEYYFDREDLYGYYDDGERFTFFSKAVYEVLSLMDFVPDIIHANDWQAALVPVFQTAVYKRTFMKTIFTIHNVQYQGQYTNTIYESVLDIPVSARRLVTMRDGVNYMKGGIESAHLVTTVSPTYAEELSDPFFAYGMDKIIARNRDKMSGILNGINTRAYDPAKDEEIAANYSARDISGKAACKRAIQKEAGLPVSDAPLLIMISRLARGKGIDLMTPVMDQLLKENDMRFIVLGTGEKEYEDFFRGLAFRHPDKCKALIRFDSALSHRLYAGADMITVPSRSEPCGLTQMIGCRYGTVPIVRETGGLKDSIRDCTLGAGNGFVFSEYRSDALRDAIGRALALYERRDDWEKLVSHDLTLDFSWSVSAGQYAGMYQQLVKGKK